MQRYIKKNRTGFTMAELLVCLAIISVIATILIPTLHNIHPDKEKTMFKKAYSISERVVEELVNDPELYPDNGINVGFDNVGAVTYNGITYGAGSSTFNEQQMIDELTSSCGELAENSAERTACERKRAAQLRPDTYARIKFCRLFAMKLNTLERDTSDEGTNEDAITLNCKNAALAMDEEDVTEDDDDQWQHNTNNNFGETGENADNEDNRNSFTTTDGMIWRMPYTNFTERDTNGNGVPSLATIWVDVNGNRPPNISDSTTGTCDPDANIDRFSITVRADGKMTVNGVCAREYVSDMRLIRNR